MSSPDPGPAREALAEVRTELARADQKAAILLALFSAIAAGIIATLATRRSGLFALWNGVEWMAWAGVGCLACSLVPLLVCVRPNGAGRLRGSAYFAFYAQYEGRPDELFAHLASSVAAADEERCGQLVDLSVLATRKYRLIARAVDLLGCALILIAGAMLLDALH
ncbi:Pycsar system effector family protein [Streptomyces fuscichromogenes]|uniref:Pycsar effector protein domain-containing protein n=1 Tax=Streptomyces fuscichromogenes TaxID=1324013 RepID=A0A917XEU9_9ACTN|nr:Pycsar system effector family protein [Streptomyces fuscichromogenes]GGN14523.1 hypothetical protein GCM10011578_042240 [Streptomyces fuscichromogenes]